MKIVFHTNLDDARRDVSELNEKLQPGSNGSVRSNATVVPRVDESIIFHFTKWDHAVKSSQDFLYTLRVVAVSYDYIKEQIVVELHMPRIFKSIVEWDEYFRRHRLGKDY